MRLRSHLHIANITADMLEEVCGIKLNRKYLKIGSVMPDILPNRRRQLHSPSKVYLHYEKELKKALDKGKQIDRISYTLGLITHYVSDAFCMSHNIYVVNLKKHIQYEYLLNKLRNDYIVSNVLIELVSESVDYCNNNGFDAKEYIERMNEEYLKAIKADDWISNIQYDIEQTIIHVVTVLNSFIEVIENNKAIHALA
jgi:hypothetical protein